jgi:hypothetical protein
MAPLMYSLCALTACLCAALLLQGYRRSRYRLLLWGGICFVILSFSNLLLIADKVLMPEIDFSAWRSATTLLGMSTLLYGLIWNTE